MSVIDYKIISVVPSFCEPSPIGAQISEFCELINENLKTGYTLNGPTRISVLYGSTPIFTQNLVKYSIPQSAKLKEYALICSVLVKPYAYRERCSEIKTFEENVMKFIKDGFVLYENFQEMFTEIGMTCHYYWQVVVKHESTD